MMDKVDIILLAAGKGARYGGDTAKQYLLIDGKTILQHTIDALQLVEINRIIIAFSEDNIETVVDSQIPIVKIIGGSTRQESVNKALEEVTTGYVIIHEAVRPGITVSIVKAILEGARETGCATTSLPPVETVFRTDNSGIGEVYDRKNTRLMQLPQAFKTDTLRKAHHQTKSLDATDDCQLCMQIGIEPRWIEGSASLMKLTYPEDYSLFEWMISSNKKVTVQKAIDDLQRGRPVIIYSEDEDEGDLCLPAQLADVELINFMVRECGGIICVPLSHDRADALELEFIGDGSPAFVTTVDSVQTGSGTSAFDRAITIKQLGLGTDSSAFRKPGHVNPLKGRPGLLDDRLAHTESSIYLVKAAGFNPAAVICEIMTPDGNMARMKELKEFAHQWNYSIVTVEEIYDYHRTINSIQ